MRYKGGSAAMVLGICYAFGKKMSSQTAAINRKELFQRACRGEATARVPVRSEAQVRRLRNFDPEAETRFLMEAIRRLVREVGPTVPVLGFAAAPWTLACYMVEGRTKEGFTRVKSFMYREPKAFRELLIRIAQATISYLQAQIAAGGGWRYFWQPPW